MACESDGAGLPTKLEVTSDKNPFPEPKTVDRRSVVVYSYTAK